MVKLECCQKIVKYGYIKEFCSAVEWNEKESRSLWDMYFIFPSNLAPFRAQTKDAQGCLALPFFFREKGFRWLLSCAAYMFAFLRRGSGSDANSAEEIAKDPKKAGFI